MTPCKLICSTVKVSRNWNIMLTKYSLLFHFVHMTTWAPLDYVLWMLQCGRPPRYTWIWVNGKSSSGVRKRCRFQLIAS
ncbi:unnamed protein product [Penicillium salamii]|uniref:Uncharacterized protein n=1 Tax=Penicillium salamii TaxID=1612424 RepID=A0A9W4P024_9EURO|nr:unnamed protein product [Penicillium salamii]CAG8107288.1 unnamed protein product [Penicillium salamii]CAG8140447.1 unnamed protein product [Penicillium salamii]CAG8177020.1 unnamed protein product [Penicillium salamii]CAG8267243.1 unnamed protein product [Penicillium salamii]